MISVSAPVRTMPLVKVTVSPLRAPPASCRIAVRRNGEIVEGDAPAAVRVAVEDRRCVRWTSVSVPQLVVMPLTSNRAAAAEEQIAFGTREKEAPVCSVPPFSSTSPMRVWPLAVAKPVVLPSAASFITSTIGVPVLPMMMLP